MSEFRSVVRHAASVLVGQLAVMSFGVADTVIAGRYSDTALAALSVGSALYVSVFIGLIGILQALLPIWGEMLGGGARAALGRSLRQSLYLAALLTALGMAVLLFPTPLLRWAEVPAGTSGEAERYLTVLALSLAPALLFRIYSSFNQALGRPLLVTWLQLGALAIKIPLSVWLVAGGGPVAPQGAVGCAWATLIVNFLLALLAIVMLKTQDLYRPFQIWRRMERPDWRQIGHFARLGIPGGLAYMVEVTSFTLMALFIARLGTVASASHQIASSVAAMLYMVPLSVSIACSARVSFWLGAGKPEAAKTVVFMAFRLLALCTSALAAIVFIANHWLAGWYSTNPVVVAGGSTLLLWVAAYHLADATQALCAFLLRCYRITVVPLLLYGVLLWGLGLYGGYWLTHIGHAGLPPSQSPVSFWMASTLAIALVAISLLWLLVRTIRSSVRGHGAFPSLG